MSRRAHPSDDAAAPGRARRPSASQAPPVLGSQAGVAAALLAVVEGGDALRDHDGFALALDQAFPKQAGQVQGEAQASGRKARSARRRLAG